MPLPVPLYKFSSVTGAEAMLNYKSIWTKSPLDFNDPFEVLPAFDEERKNLHVASRKEFYGRMGNATWGDLVEGGGEENIPVENWIDLAGRVHDGFYSDVDARFRVLCFSRDPNPTLLWSHYSESHKGIAIGFDFSQDGVPLGRFPEGLRVNYVADRCQLKLPLDHYKSAALKFMTPTPPGFVYHGGLLITEAELGAIYEQCLFEFLSTKQEAWSYEAETRLVYDLAKNNRDGLSSAADHDSLRFGAEAVTEVIFGYHCPVADVERVATLLTEEYPHVKLKYVDLHPYKYEVTVHDGDLRQILTSHKVRQQNSFRSPTRRRR